MSHHTVPDMGHMDHIADVASEDIRELQRKEATYKGSWKKRGGPGAFMMLARKWDRLEAIAEDNGYDIFAVIMDDCVKEAQAGKASGQDGSLLAEVRDLRRYLTLVEAEMLHRAMGTPEDTSLDTDPVLMRKGLDIDPDEEITGSSVRHGPDGMENPRGYDAEEEGR